MQKLIQIFILIAIFTNCSEDETVGECTLLGQKYAGFKYNAKGQVVAIHQLNDANGLVENGNRREFIYEEGKLIRIDEFAGEVLLRYFLFRHSTNQIIQEEYWDADPETDNALTYTLDRDGRVIRLVNESDGYVLYTRTYEYEGENVVKVTSTGIFNYTQEFEFDDKYNPIRIEGVDLSLLVEEDEFFSYRTQNVNNITQLTWQGPGFEPIVNTFRYSYNPRHYALKVFEGRSTTPIWFYQYECK